MRDSESLINLKKLHHTDPLHTSDEFIGMILCFILVNYCIFFIKLPHMGMLTLLTPFLYVFRWKYRDLNAVKKSCPNLCKERLQSHLK